MKGRWRRGAALLQTLVMAVTLSMMAVMVMKWVLARYLLAARSYRATAAKGSSHMVSEDRLSTWNPWNPAYANLNNIPASQTLTTYDGVPVNYQRTGGGAGASFAITVTVVQD